MERIKNLQKALTGNKIDCALLLYHRDVYYYAGTARPAALAVTQDDAVLFARRVPEQIRSESGIGDVREGGLRSIADWMKGKGLQKGTVGIEMDVVPAAMYLKLKELLPECDLTDISPLIFEQRIIKDAGEIESIRGACRILEEAHRQLPRILKEGMTEIETSAELERFVRLHGHETFAFLRRKLDSDMSYVGVLSGENTKIIGGYGQVVTGKGLSPAVPYGPSRRKIEAGDTVVFDIAGLNQGYHSDLARTYCMGKANPKILEAHSALVAIQSEIIRAARPGVPTRQIYEIAVRKAEGSGWGDYFQGCGKQKGTFVGHGLGLEIDEPPLFSPRDKTVLKENMTFTVELFIVHPDFGEVKLEDTFLMTKDGPEFLTGIDRKVFEI